MFIVMKVSGGNLQTIGPTATPMLEEAADTEARRLCAAARDEAFVLVEVVADYTWEPTVIKRERRPRTTAIARRS